MASPPTIDGDNYTTVVICHESPECARNLSSELLGRFPMFAETGSRITMIGIGDAASVADAARMALETRLLSQDERVELALDLLECQTWGACLAKFLELALSVDGSELVENQPEQSQ